MKITVILVNKAIPAGMIGKLVGFSGICYAQSYYETGYGGSVARMSIEEYRAAKKDIALGCGRPLSQWEIDFEFAEEVTGVEDVLNKIRAAGTSEELDAIVATQCDFVQSIYARAKELYDSPQTDDTPGTEAGSSIVIERNFESTDGPPLPIFTEDSLAPLRYFSLVKIAKQLGLRPDDFSDTGALRMAILEKQESLLAA